MHHHLLHIPLLFIFFPLSHVLQAEPEPISTYHPMMEEVSAAIGTPIEGFFDGADVVAQAMASAALVAAQGVLAKTPIPSIELGPVDKGA